MLARKYRPQHLSEISGQSATVAVLSRMLERNKLPLSILLSGISGTGKTSVARILGAALNCTRPETPDAPGRASVPPCGACKPCQAVWEGSSLSVLEIDGASNGSVDRIRELRETLAYEQIGRRVVIIDEAHSLSREAFNALLKTLEEGLQVTLILVTTEPHKIPKTVRSRTMEFEFGRISAYAIAKRLAHIRDQEQIEIPDDVLAQIAIDAQGKSRDAIMRLDLCARAEIDNLIQYRILWPAPDALRLVETMLGGHIDHVFLVSQDIMVGIEPEHMIDALVNALRDLLTVRAANPATSSNLDAEALGLSYPVDDLIALAGRVDPMALFKALRLLWELRTRLSAQARAHVDLALVMLTEALSGFSAKQIQQMKKQEEAIQPISLSEMERM